MKQKPGTPAHQRGAGGGSPQDGGKPRRENRPGAGGKGAARQSRAKRPARACSLSSRESAPRKPNSRRAGFKPYDYDETFQQQIDPRDEAEIRRLIDQQRVAVYATKRINAGTQMDVEVYPEFTHLPKYAARRHMTPEARQNLDYRNSRKECERKINDNFGTGDLWITLDYAPRFLPATEEEAARNLRNWVRRVNYSRKKKGLPTLRYVYVNSWAKDGRKVRCHHHVIADGAQPAEEMRALWPYGKRGKATTLEKDERGLSGLAYYLTKHSAPETGERTHKKKWAASKNLRQPIEHKNHQDFRRRAVERMAEQPAQIATAMEAKYPTHWCESTEAMYNGVVGLFYIRAVMRERPQVGDLVTISGKPGAVTIPQPTAAAELFRMTAKEKRLQVVAVDYGTPARETVTVQAPGGRRQITVNARACIIADKSGRGRSCGY